MPASRTNPGTTTGTAVGRVKRPVGDPSYNPLVDWSQGDPIPEGYMVSPLDPGRLTTKDSGYESFLNRAGFPIIGGIASAGFLPGGAFHGLLGGGGGAAATTTNGAFASGPVDLAGAATGATGASGMGGLSLGSLLKLFGVQTGFNALGGLIGGGGGQERQPIGKGLSKEKADYIDPGNQLFTYMQALQRLGQAQQDKMGRGVQLRTVAQAPRGFAQDPAALNPGLLKYDFGGDLYDPMQGFGARFKAGKF